MVVDKMIISRPKLPLYGLIIVLSVLIGMIYVFLELKKHGYKDKQIMYFFIIYISFAFLGGKMYTMITYNKQIGFWQSGLSAYGGLLGVVVGAIIFEKILYCKGELIKYAILSLPLVYGLTKIACFISGCCNGIPYNGIFKVIYKDDLNIGQFPIQIVETIIFLIIFFICHRLKDKKNISYTTIILVSIFKFLLDFLRYEHISIFLSKNQLFSLILLITTIIIFVVKKKEKIKNI